MIGLDTNVLVRFLTQDDPVQGALASDLISRCSSKAPGFIAREVMVELVWVLERAYRLSRDDIAMALDGLLEAEELVVERADDVAVALHHYRRDGHGFADMMVTCAAVRAGCETLCGFDRKAARHPLITLVE